ncbi:putative hydro-lyase [Candidatus Puniceispirillum sp.]|nr:putative hydro-lyase [Candidatus Puniceispirillum sp.]
MKNSFEQLRQNSQTDVRSKIRSGSYCDHTSGLAQGFLQANVVILEKSYAYNFIKFCERNRKPCPLVGVTQIGSPYLHTLGTDIDIRTDVPSYNIYRYGVLDDTITDITTLWTDQMVGFALGCSFTFEHELIRAGIPIWHIDNDRTVPMFKTSIKTIQAGPFFGPMVVSMRAVPIKKLAMVRAISANFQMAHGAPVHWGNPADIGIADLNAPDWGDPSPIGDCEIAVFWACGVTPQAAILQAKPKISITHKPGRMLITDIAEDAEVPSILTTG